MTKKLLTFIKFIISFGILGIILFKLDIGSLYLNIYTINLAIIVIPILLLLLQISLSTLKWKIILDVENVQVPFIYLLKNYLIGNFISLFLPSSFGGDLYRIYSLKRYNLDLSKNASSVLFDRISGLLALISISLISYIVFYGGNISIIYTAVIIVILIAYFIITSELPILKSINTENRLAKFINGVLISFNRYKNNKKALLKVFIISFIFQFNIVLIVKLYCMSLDIVIDIQYLLMVVPLIYLTEALPISINGIGVRDSAFIFFFYQIGRTKEEAIAVSLLIIFMRYAFGLIFGGPLLLKTIWFGNERTIIERSTQ